MNEHSLHSTIKNWYSIPGDEFEVKIDDFIIDIKRRDLLIEIQTTNFFSIKKKLETLTKNHPVRLVHPIPQHKWIIRTTNSGEVMNRRKSPKKGKIADLFYELVSFPHLVGEDRFSLEILMIREEEVRCNDGTGSWRRRGISIKDRRLIDVVDRILFRNKQDFLRFLPFKASEHFTNRKLAKFSGESIDLTRKITYCLRKMGAIIAVDRNGKELIFTDFA